ncbi:ATP-dependent helicase RIS1 [Verticillium dahliae]|nr:ATP-dependent helicase RIS1 [Verticillium dahliae]
MKKPGAGFAFQPRNTIASEAEPDFTKSPRKPRSNTQSPRHHIAVRAITMVNERAPPRGPSRPIHDNRESQPGASRPDRPASSDFDPDALTARFDALRVTHGASQTAPQQPSTANSGAKRAEKTGPPPVKAPPPPAKAPRDRPTDSDDALSAFFSDRRDPFGAPSSQGHAHGHGHAFGHPTKMMSSLKQKAHGIFNERRARPEHHRDDKHRINVPSVPIYQDRKPEPLNLFRSIGPDAHPATYKAPAAGRFGEPDFYTDPTKATSDLKALLEGGMDEDEDEDEDEEGSPEEKKKNKPADKKDGKDRNDGSLDGLRVKLLPHQVEGVEWMKGRELGPVKKGRVPKGGILADDMGLGKTLQTISLILSNQKPPKDDKEKGWKKHFEGVEKTTLVVAPLALIRQWEAEIKDKVERSHGLKVCVHHGPQRTKRFKDLAMYDVVVTTYQILVSEHGHSSDADNGVKAGCFGLHWWRVVLDEAHTIKNRNAKSTKACCALRAEYRWCLSGTPMQNNLEELQSLIQFLRIRPYDDLAEWKDQIEKPLKNGKGHIAIRRLHSLLRCFMKRRTKDILKVDGALNPGGKPTKEGDESSTGFKVTERKVVTVASKLSPAERRFYDRLEARTDESLERMQGNMNYANALVLLLRLRQACNHPKLVAGKLDKDKDALSSGDASQKNAAADVDSLADMFGGMGIVAKTCGICGRDLPRDAPKTDQDTCQECLDDLAYFNENETARDKKPRSKKPKVKKIVETVKVASPVQTKSRRPRNRRTVIDSDDEDEEEEENEGSWLVPEDQRGQLRLGKAGGDKDENCEGGGEWLGTEDSLHESSRADESTQLDSFIVDDEKRAVKAEAGSDSESDDSFASVAEIASQVQAKKEERTLQSAASDSDDSASQTSSDEDTGIDESELQSDDDAHGRRGGGPASQILASAKIRQMMQILHKEVHEHKFIVFSQFTSMMDLIEPFFRKDGLRFTRYDGGMKNDEREASLDRLRNDDKTRILLCSLKCGSLGLNLTAATRVIIVEPFWNPFVEEQAIDRVHRLTQTIDVVVYRLIVEATVEDRILALQEKKRLLAQTAIEGGMKKDVIKFGLREMLDLFRRDNHAAAVEPEPELEPEPEGRRNVAAARKQRATPEHEVYGRRW